jgi:hypothetical protein
VVERERKNALNGFEDSAGCSAAGDTVAAGAAAADAPAGVDVAAEGAAGGVTVVASPPFALVGDGAAA